MSRMSLSSLLPGMKVQRTVYGSRGEILIFKGGILTNAFIKKLEEHAIPFVYIDDGLEPDIQPRSSAGANLFKMNVQDVVAKETRVAAIRQVKNILLETKEAGRLVIEPQAVYSTVNQFTSELLSSKSLMVNLTDLRSQDDYTFAHSVNVCVLSLMTGITLGFNNEELANLGIGALLHDLGKVKIPDEILNKPGKLTREEYSTIQKHTTYGYNLILNSKNLDKTHALIAYQHHESYDGSGYPLGIKDDKFIEQAQIISIADKFDALTADRVYRRSFPPHEAYEMCAASGDYLFREHIVSAFLYNIAAYPSGSLVKLNNGYIAVVIDTPRGYSTFPRVNLLFDQNHRQLSTPKEISLAEAGSLFVTKVLTVEEIKALQQKIQGQ
ncbi:HD-GYP domain-containing protein [Pelotomaculum propionicicum]|uniref:Cyclic di-GMP phosphodiesterase response regulator RpfG n=1 Tax=Pelotomaculum propionicicum TaxID=258475 RepID=A0A4Y7RNF9_9FIRM|nr:HD-GYP domain-containing protein [Pelotomaculum propionicicum]NLI12864.1 HD-GYP domain-containing protein [Peptococcaceae bacterium]TEB10290.1 Cyclic di-GMP phosphodiesterase response regulator RpfG [Pelotomaculum propionicicum]